MSEAGTEALSHHQDWQNFRSGQDSDVLLDHAARSAPPKLLAPGAIFTPDKYNVTDLV